MLELNTIHCGDAMAVMQDIDSDSVDCIVTDPPYQLSSPGTKNVTKGFMGKTWDICPSIDIWQQCLRVLKPGAFAFVMCIPRQDCLARMVCRLEDAGFNVSFSSVYHTFASGFPKAQNHQKVFLKKIERQLEAKYRIEKVEWEE